MSGLSHGHKNSSRGDRRLQATGESRETLEEEEARRCRHAAGPGARILFSTLQRRAETSKKVVGWGAASRIRDERSIQQSACSPRAAAPQCRSGGAV